MRAVRGLRWPGYALLEIPKILSTINIYKALQTITNLHIYIYIQIYNWWDYLITCIILYICNL